MENAITISQLIVATIAVIATVGIPIMVGLFNVLKSINQTNTRLNHIEKNQEKTSPNVSKIPAIESRLRSLEQTRSDQLPQQTQMIQMLSSLTAKIDGQMSRAENFENKFDRKFEQYDEQRAEFLEKYSHVLNERT